MATKTRGPARRKASSPEQALQDAVLAERAHRLAQPDRKIVDLSYRPTALVCAIADNLYALPLDTISRAVQLKRLGAAPTSDPTLVGLAVDAGHVLQVFDLAARLNLAPSSREGDGYMLVLRHGRSALRVDHRPIALQIETIADDENHRAQITDPTSPLDGKVVVMLSPDTLISPSPRPQPEPISP